MNFPDWFNDRHTPEPMSGCWLWTGSLSSKGYAVAAIGPGRRAPQFRVSRFVLEATTGKTLGELRACHRCDNPACVNPAHLYAGTDKDNARDRVVRGRAPAGDRHGGAKLTSSAVREIREARKRGVMLKDLAARFGVSISRVHAAAKGINWRNA